MKNIISGAIKELLDFGGIDKNIYDQFAERLKRVGGYTKSEHVPDHFCVFFVPFHRESLSVYLGHHIKADDWIPPGGHLEPNEPIFDAVRREYFEELSYKLTDEKIELFRASTKKINHPLGYCATHYDIWTVVTVKEPTKYSFLKKEFHDAGWFNLRDAAEKIRKNPDYRAIIEELGKSSGLVK